jgi:SAM-dependent methyltransferase
MSTNFTKAILQWDVNSWNVALKFWESKIDWHKIKTGLELGGREGGLSLWAAKHGVQMICSDLDNVKPIAEPLHAQYNVTDFIKYDAIDATQIPYENHFDLIVFKSIIGGIGANNNFAKQQQVFDAIYKALKPDGQLVFAENLVASPLHQKLRKRFIEWGKDWRYISMKETETFLNPFTSFEIQATGVLGTFGRSEAQRTVLSKLDQLLINHITPNSWKYIVYGIAKK